MYGRFSPEVPGQTMQTTLKPGKLLVLAQCTLVPEILVAFKPAEYAKMMYVHGSEVKKTLI